MSQFISDLKSNFTQRAEIAVENFKILGRWIVSFDRSGQIFSESPEKQLKERAKSITNHIFIAFVMLPF